MTTVNVRFRCGHFERMTEHDIKKQCVQVNIPFKINGKIRSESDENCLDCSRPKATNERVTHE